MTVDQILRRYAASRQRLLLLDYDGTLVNLHRKPELAKPPARLLELLRRLSENPGNTLVVISGRDHRTLGDWLGHLPIHLIAEHGFFTKSPGGPWQATVAIDTAWKTPVRAAMETSVASIDRSFIEEKASALVWHYRAAARGQNSKEEADRLMQRLKPLAAVHQLRVSPGSFVIDVHPEGVDKGSAARQWLKQAAWNFVLIAGDDTTDEDLFRAAPADSITVKVGDGPTAAKQHIPDVPSFRNLLEKLK